MDIMLMCLQPLAGQKYKYDVFLDTALAHVISGERLLPRADLRTHRRRRDLLEVAVGLRTCAPTTWEVRVDYGHCGEAGRRR